MNLPIPESSLKEFAQGLFVPIADKLCTTGFFVAGGGKRTLIRFLLQEQTILKNIFGAAYPKTLFVIVDPDEILEDSNQAYLQLLFDSLQMTLLEKGITEKLPPLTNPFLKLKKTLSELTQDGWHIVFILNDFEYTLNLSSSIFRNLEGLFSLNKQQISYMFLTTINLLNESVLKKFHNLKYAINRKIYYWALLSESDSSYVIDFFAKKYGAEPIPLSIKSTINEICGGHPQLLKYSTKVVTLILKEKPAESVDIKEQLLQHSQLPTICADVWNFLDEREQELLTLVVKTGNLPEKKSTQAQFLLSMRLVAPKDTKHFRVFGLLFEQFIKDRTPQQKLHFDKTTNQLFYGLRTCGDTFTLQEFKLLTYFLENEGTVVSRDQVAEVLWGKESIDKYSDWTIDKTVSTIRKKLSSISFPSEKLVTLKKRGFTFNQ